MLKSIIIAIIAFAIGMIWGAGIMSMLIASKRRPPLRVAQWSGKMERPAPWPVPPPYNKFDRKTLKRRGITSSVLEECD